MPLVSPADIPLQRYKTISGNYVVTDQDNGTMLEIDGGNVELSASATVGTVVFVRQVGTGSVRFAAGTGATLRSQGGLVTIAAQWVTVTVDKRSATEWVLSGTLA